MKDSGIVNQAVSTLQQQLDESASDYRLLKPHSAYRVDIQFIGKLDGVEVVWDAQIMTLGEYLHSRPVSDTSELKQFIEIVKSNDQYRLQVALNVPAITEAVIRSTIIMIRQYKRLRIGRHEYGDVVVT